MNYDRDENLASSSSSTFSRRQFLAAVAGGIALSPPAIAWLEIVRPGEPGAYDDPLHYATLSTAASLLKTGEISPTALTQQLLNRIGSVDSSLHSYVTVMADHAMESARRAEDEIGAGSYRGDLHGIPIAVKDLCDMRGVPTMAGTTVLADRTPDSDSTVVARLEAAGAVVLGKLALCEGAQAPYHPDLEVPVNPWDPTRWSGVSSSGCGVATSAGLCFASVASDTGGSIRYPAAANGCVGLKPTYGRVSRYGVFPLAESLDHVGPMARSDRDAAIMFECMAGFDPRDPTSLNRPVPDIAAALGREIAGLRIGFDHDYASGSVDPEVVGAVERVVRELELLGAEIIEINMPDVGDPTQLWYTLGTVEAAAAHAGTFPSRADEYGPGFRSDLEYGLSITGVDYANAYKARAELAAGVHRLLAKVDCFVCPSMSNPAPVKSEDPTFMTAEEWSRLVINDIFSKPFNFSGVPTLSVPCGFTDDGLPLSVQFVGSQLDEEVICRVGHAFEQATPWHKRHPPI